MHITSLVHDHRSSGKTLIHPGARPPRFPHSPSQTVIQTCKTLKLKLSGDRFKTAMFLFGSALVPLSVCFSPSTLLSAVSEHTDVMRLVEHTSFSYVLLSKYSVLIPSPLTGEYAGFLQQL